MNHKLLSRHFVHKRSLAFPSWLAGIALAFLALTALHADEPSAANSAGHDYSQLIEQLAQTIRSEMEQKQIPSFSIALVADGKVISSAGFGFQDAEKTIPASGKTVYRVGSISKLLTDVALMQLVEQDELDLDQPVQKVLPEFKIADDEHSKKITLRQLTQHRAGIVRESPVGNYFDPTEPGLKATVASLANTPPVYEPDTRTKYSNAGVSVIGLAVEQAAGSSHPNYVQQHVLEPLGMTHTSFEKNEALAEHTADGWMWGYDRPAFAAPEFLLGTGPAGNLYSSVEDLAQFSLFVMDQHPTKVLRDNSLTEMLQPGVTPDGKPLPYGIGFRVSDFHGHRRVGHGGAVYGFSTQLEILPDENIAVIAASSLDGTNNWITRICNQALEGMLAVQNDQDLTPPVSTEPVPRSRARSLAGVYSSMPGEASRTVTVDWIGDRLLLWKGTFQREIRSRSDTGELVLDDRFGFGTSIRQDQSFLVIDDKTYTRLSDAPPPEIQDEWRDLIGEYGWDHNTLYILERHGQLHALIEWFYYYPLDEVAEDRFAFPDHGLYHGEELIFRRDDSGEVTEVIAAQVAFQKREVGTKAGETFKIKRELPVDKLHELADSAKPPREEGNFRPSELTELTTLDPSIELDIRYATTNNFMDTVFYQQPRAFAQRPAAEAAVKVHQELKKQNLGLLIHDAYRPWRVTKMFWDATPSKMKNFVANPAQGSRHNRGCALDLTLFDRTTQEVIPMVSGYDEFSPRSFPLYPGGTQRERYYRGLLRRAMETAGFQVYEFEWWHFDFDGWQKYRIGNLSFEETAN
ncbi:serine hydrolase [Rhodopirellula europaea]|uniref:D-alanyl-D-alanine dipeptidase n=1 Tax=Rhodopirellula europaea 6C TaxID=1263867 RepID=M2A5D2_9BACT|nr:serine hydrolase [Rhodopirellula europaea]EMB15351.1 Beta-lactamase-related protein [Rhodopirellula europaea 6C]